MTCRRTTRRRMQQKRVYIVHCDNEKVAEDVCGDEDDDEDDDEDALLLDDEQTSPEEAHLGFDELGDDDVCDASGRVHPTRMCAKTHEHIGAGNWK